MKRFSATAFVTIAALSACSRVHEAFRHPELAKESLRNALEDSKAAVSKGDPVQKILRPLPSLGSERTPEENKAAIEKVNAVYYYLVGMHLSERGRPGDALVAFDQLKKIDDESTRVYLNLAKELLKKGLMAEGVAAARKSLELDPRNRDAKLFLANLFATAKKYADAVRLFEEVAREDPDDEDVMLYLALIETETKQTEKALQRIRGFLNSNPESALAHYYLGRLQQEKGNAKEAAAAYRRAIDIRPGFVQAGTFLGFLQEESGDRQGAIETYSWLSVQTDDASFHKKLGHLLLDDNQYKGALKAFENYERLDKADLNNKLKIALVHLELKEYGRAEGKMREILQTAPDSDNVRYYLAAVLEQKGDAKAALGEYAKIPAASKLFFEANKRMIYAYARAKDYSAGRKLLTQLDATVSRTEAAPAAARLGEKGSPENAPSETSFEDVFEVGINFYESFLPEKTDELRAYLDTALKQYPRSPRLLYLKGGFLERIGRAEEAVLVMQDLLRNEPNNAAALNFVGYAWAERGQNLAQAETYIKRALKLRPKEPFMTDSLAWVYYKQGQYRKALGLLEEAYAQRPDEAVIADHMGDVLVKLGRLDDARKYYEIALKLGPAKDTDRSNLEKKLARLQGVIKSGCSGIDARCAHLVLDEPRSPAASTAK